MFLLLLHSCFFFFFNDTATTEIYTLSLHDALPIISESVNFCVMEAIKLCRLDTPIIFIEARINLIGVSNLDRKSGSAGMPRPISYTVFCLKKKKSPASTTALHHHASRQLHHIPRS